MYRKKKSSVSTSAPIWLVLIVFLLLITPWVLNFVKLASCDFEPDYKCEVIHGIGVVVPPASYITVWFADDGD